MKSVPFAPLEPALYREAVRRALDAMLAESRGRNRESAFGAWAPRGDSRKVVDALREEWSR